MVSSVVPDHSTYKPWSQVTHISHTWHTVYYPPLGLDRVAWEYCDRELTHAWSMGGDHWYFENESEAVQFALVFGDCA